MIELIFVIVILGILGGIAVPRLAGTRTDAHITKGRADVAAIRMSIAMTRSENLLSGNAQFPADLGSNPDKLFENIFTQPIVAGSATDQGRWRAGNANQFIFRVATTDITFTYIPATGVFNCERNDKYCTDLID
jgi:general secretion pathway protein G